MMFILIAAGVLLFSVAPIVLGFVALGRIDGQSPPRSRGFALAAIGLGLLWLFAIPVAVVLFGMMAPRAVTSRTFTLNGGGSSSVITVSPPTTFSTGSGMSSIVVDGSDNEYSMASTDLQELIANHGALIQNAETNVAIPAFASKYLNQARGVRANEPRLPAEVAAALKADEMRIQALIEPKVARPARAMPPVTAPTVVPAEAADPGAVTKMRTAEYSKVLDLAMKAIDSRDAAAARDYLNKARALRDSGIGYTTATKQQYAQVEEQLASKIAQLESALKADQPAPPATKKSGAAEIDTVNVETNAPAAPGMPAPPAKRGAVGETNPFDDDIPARPDVNANTPEKAPATQKAPAKEKASVGEQDPF